MVYGYEYMNIFSFFIRMTREGKQGYSNIKSNER